MSLDSLQNAAPPGGEVIQKMGQKSPALVALSSGAGEKVLQQKGVPPQEPPLDASAMVVNKLQAPCPSTPEECDGDFGTAPHHAPPKSMQASKAPAAAKSSKAGTKNSKSSLQVPPTALEERCKARASRPATRFDPDAANQQSQMEKFNANKPKK